jgi:hypothetical protein
MLDRRFIGGQLGNPLGVVDAAPADEAGAAAVFVREHRSTVLT